jgi:flagellar L-ring protein FlgH
MKQAVRTFGLSLVLGSALSAGKLKISFDKQGTPSALDLYVAQAHQAAAAAAAESPGSLWLASAALSEISSDLRARNVNDILTIVVNEQASAVSTGNTKTQRTSSANGGGSSALLPQVIANRVGNLVTYNGNQSLSGQGTTSRTTTLTTTITARVTDVLPNGYLVVEGAKTILVNSETQTITLRGVVRPNDLTTTNQVQSGSVGQMELKINGRGVVNDAVHRPNFLYRLLLGVLPF